MILWCFGHFGILIYDSPQKYLRIRVCGYVALWSDDSVLYYEDWSFWSKFSVHVCTSPSSHWVCQALGLGLFFWPTLTPAFCLYLSQVWHWNICAGFSTRCQSTLLSALMSWYAYRWLLKFSHSSYTPPMPSQSNKKKYRFAIANQDVLGLSKGIQCSGFFLLVPVRKAHIQMANCDIFHNFQLFEVNLFFI